MKRSKPMKRTGPPKPVSDKRRAKNDVRREEAFHFPHERCWIGSPVCTGWADAWHELVGRAHTGSITDKRNICAACNRCNRWIEDHPTEARRQGWKVPAYEAMPGDGGLVPKVLNPFSLAYRMQEGWT